LAQESESIRFVWCSQSKVSIGYKNSKWEVFLYFIILEQWKNDIYILQLTINYSNKILRYLGISKKRSNFLIPLFEPKDKIITSIEISGKENVIEEETNTTITSITDC